MIKMLGAAFGLLLLFGCGSTREAAKAATLTDEGIAAAQKVVATEPDPEVMRKKLSDILYGARVALQPVLSVLSADYSQKELQVTVAGQPVSEDVIIANPEAYVQASIRQAAKVEAEAESNRTIIGEFGSMFGLLEGLLAGSGLLGLIAAKLLKTVRDHKEALKDQISYTRDIRKLVPDEAVDPIKREHAARQSSKGTKKIIEDNLARVK